MDFYTIILILISVLAVIVGVLLGYDAYIKRKLSSEEEERRSGSKPSDKKQGYIIYKLCRHIPGLRQYVNKIETRVSLLYPSDAIATRNETSRILKKITATVILGGAVTLIIANWNILFIISGFFVTIILVSEVETNSFNKVEDVINVQLKDAIDHINSNFSSSPLPDLALQRTIETMMREGKHEIVLHLTNIREITRSKETAVLLDEYAKTCPNKHLLTLAMIFCSIIEYGDIKVDNDRSLFLQSLQSLKLDVSDEIIERHKTKDAFSGANIMCLVVVLLVKPAESWAMTNMPEAAPYYTGIYGIAAMMGVVLISFICYHYIINLRDGDKLGAIRTNSIWRRIAAFPLLNALLSKEIKYHYVKYERKNDMMRQSGDRTGVKAYLTEKICLALAMFAMCVAIIMTGTLQKKIELVKDYSNAFSETITPNASYKKVCEEAATNYAEVVHHYKNISEEELAQMIRSEKGIKSDDDAKIIAKTILERDVMARNQYFKWYHLLIALVFAIAGFYFPDFMLYKKRAAATAAMEEEMIVFQSLAIILMNIPGTTLEIMLSWMKRFSYCFNPLISECNQNLAKGTRKALEDFRFKAQDEFKPLATFIQSLESIEDCGVYNAFVGVKGNMDFIKAERSVNRNTAREKNANLASLLSLVPLYGVIALQLIVPLGMMAINMYKTMNF